MLTARSVLIAAVAIAVVSLVAATLSLMRPPGADGMGDDSYGTRAHGQRALFETLEELGVPVERVLIPPTEILERPITLVLWGPHQNLVAIEPVYLRQIGEWVRSGGRVVVAPGVRSAILAPMALREDDDRDVFDPALVLEELGLEDMLVDTVSLTNGASDESDDFRTDDEPESFREILERERAKRQYELERAAIEAEGDLRTLETLVAALQVPTDGLRVLDTEGTQPTGRVLIRAPAGDEYVVAARYRAGEGEVVVVSDPRLFENRLIAREDNAVLAYHLLADEERPLVFDEFYHGLTIRGNPLYLVAQFPFGLITLAILGVVGLWIWRRAVSIGPPLEAKPATRRTVTEYVEAMARLFQRSRASRPFLLREFRDGALWTLRHDLGLPPGREDPEEIAAVLARRDPEAARELREAIAAIDRLLAGARRPSEEQSIQVLQRVSACL